MPEFYPWTILLINQLGEIGKKQLSVFGSRGGQISPLMHVPLCQQKTRTMHSYSNGRHFGAYEILALCQGVMPITTEPILVLV